mmetsp:Transcript_42828/g.56601  ORF Transcript_42828/g.56601 Transcript_42828/m.56601 type:complete len:89 (+) Transcript_42828:375-641(+)
MFGILDTATEFIALQGHECRECKRDTYDIRPAMDRGTAGIGANPEKVPYGGKMIEGIWGFDTICYALNQCIELMDFFYLSESAFEEPV